MRISRIQGRSRITQPPVRSIKIKKRNDFSSRFFRAPSVCIRARAFAARLSRSLRSQRCFFACFHYLNTFCRNRTLAPIFCIHPRNSRKMSRSAWRHIQKHDILSAEIIFGDGHMSFLSKIRSTKARMPLGKMALNTAAVLLLGIALGVFSKYLDYRQASLPQFLMLIDEALDLHNFLGRFPFWVAAALCISVYSNSSARAAVNVFAFFCRHGLKLLCILEICGRLLSQKLRYDLGRVHNHLAAFGIYLLVLQGQYKGFHCSFLNDIRRYVQYDLRLRLALFRRLLSFGADNLCFQRDYFMARSNKGNRAHDSLGHCHCVHIEGCNALSPRVMHGDSQASDRRSNVNGKQKGAADFAAPYLINL